MMTSSDMMQEAFGTLLFAAVVIWAAYKMINTSPKDEDDDIHLGI